MQKIKKVPTVQEACNKLSARCAQAEYAPRDLLAKMRQWGMDEQSSAAVMQCLTTENFVSEERYAHAFVHDKFQFSGWGKMKMSFALKQKGIGEAFILKALDEIPEADYEQQLQHLLADKAKNTQAKSPYELRGKLIRFGVGRGYEQDVVFKILERLPEEPKGE